LAHIQLTGRETPVLFDVFAADLRTGELFKDGQRVVLPNQSFLALAALLERPGELVSREELRARLWPDGRVVEFEQGLNAIINRLREALGDSASAPKYIETLPRRGYRFIAAVAQPPPAPLSPSGPEVPVRLYGLGVLLALLVLLVSVMGPGQRGADVFANPTLQRLTSSVGREVSPSFAPDGRSFVFGWNGVGESGFDLYIKKLDSEHLLRLTHDPATAISPAWALRAVAHRSDGDWRPGQCPGCRVA
jgi:DNA-binding winged helix-turn-helix (wHTH) protein